MKFSELKPLDKIFASLIILIFGGLFVSIGTILLLLIMQGCR